MKSKYQSAYNITYFTIFALNLIKNKIVGNFQPAYYDTLKIT